jgi:DNA-binding NtrC family response regulator
VEHSTRSIASLADLFAASSRPVYAIDARRQIVYCNTTLADWLGLDVERIVGRYVEYHSEAATEDAASRQATGPLIGLCPPPQALGGAQCVGTVGCVARGGRLVHRHGDFVPLFSDGERAASPGGGVTGNGRSSGGVLVVLAPHDMSPQELSAELSAEPSGDELHRAIRRFRRNQTAQYAVDALLGESSAMRRVRAQVAAAAASQANVLVRGRRGSGRAHVARAIHYQAAADSVGRLVPVDSEVASEDLLRRTVDSLRNAADSRRRATLLVLNLEQLAPELQSGLLSAVRDAALHARFVATLGVDSRGDGAVAGETDRPTPVVSPPLVDALSTITINVPRLADRLEDLPLLVQCFLEATNRGNAKQIGSIRPEALDLLALYRWPGELDELRSVISAAHATSTTHEIGPADLPAVIHHAAQAAALPRRTTEKIVLDELLASIEREVISRAMAQAGGNKTAAAELLGMTRPRLYRRLVQLGMAAEEDSGTGGRGPARPSG